MNDSDEVPVIFATGGVIFTDGPPTADDVQRLVEQKTIFEDPTYSHRLTVGMLRELLRGIPDDVPIHLTYEGAAGWLNLIEIEDGVLFIGEFP